MSKIAKDIKDVIGDYCDECVAEQKPRTEVHNDVKDWLEDEISTQLEIKSYQMLWLDSERLQVDFVPTDDVGTTYGMILYLPYLPGATVELDTNTAYDRAMQGI